MLLFYDKSEFQVILDMPERATLDSSRAEKPTTTDPIRSKSLFCL